MVLSNGQYPATQIKEAEVAMSTSVGWALLSVSAVQFMEYLLVYARLDHRLCWQLLNRAQLALNCALLEYSFIGYRSVLLAASAIICAHREVGASTAQFECRLKELDTGVDLESVEACTCCDELEWVLERYRQVSAARVAANSPTGVQEVNSLPPQIGTTAAISAGATATNQLAVPVSSWVVGQQQESELLQQVASDGAASCAGVLEFPAEVVAAGQAGTAEKNVNAKRPRAYPGEVQVHEGGFGALKRQNTGPNGRF